MELWKKNKERGKDKKEKHVRKKERKFHREIVSW